MFVIAGYLHPGPILVMLVTPGYLPPGRKPGNVVIPGYLPQYTKPGNLCMSYAGIYPRNQLGLPWLHPGRYPRVASLVTFVIPGYLPQGTKRGYVCHTRVDTRVHPDCIPAKHILATVLPGSETSWGYFRQTVGG